MQLIPVTDDTSHADRSWLKAIVPANILLISVTDDTSHADRSWLKVIVLEKIPPISVTDDTSHADRSWLKLKAFWNMLCISVTADTSHDAIGPCEHLEQSPTGDSSMHALIASLSSVLFWGANAAVAAANHSEPVC